MFDRAAAVGRLHRIAREQVVQFLEGPDKGDVYGVGLFCDARDGRVYLVANTARHHQSSLRAFEARFGRTDPEAFRWDVGNWKHPGGLFPSSSAEQQAFDAAWEEYRQQLPRIEGDQKQAMLEEVCIEVLTRLANEGVFRRHRPAATARATTSARVRAGRRSTAKRRS